MISDKSRNQKLLLWFARTIIAIAIYYFLWEYRWIRWTLLVYVPLNIIGLLMVLYIPYYMNRKANRLSEKAEIVDESSFNDH